MKVKKLPLELSNLKDCVVGMSENGWMNEKTTLEWLNKCWRTIAFSRRLQAWDAFCAHKTSKVKSTLRKMQTDVALIPAADAPASFKLHTSRGISPLRQRMCQCTKHWVSTAGCLDSNRTEAGNPCAPSKLLLCQWVVKDWNTLARDLIINPFSSQD